MLEHLEAFQASVDESPFGETSRAIDTVAYGESVRHVHRELLLAGYYVERHEFEWAGVRGENVIVELPGTSDDVIMLGAHMDSVAAGPGINDNASGVAALLEIAEHLREGPRPHFTVRFAFWGAEEGGPFGSSAYVDALVPEELARITAYLNLDMLASPNAVRFVYDEAGAAPGSEELTDAFGAAFDEAGLAWEPIDLEGDSDHGPFTDAGIPTGGLFSGGIEPLTDAQAARFGAVAGEPADPCSHRPCDTIENVDLQTLEQMADALATVLETLARTQH